MKLEINNKINLGDQTELVHEVHDCQVVEKGESLYITYINSAKEKVVIKCQEQELTMTRYSNPKSIMRFHSEFPALVAIPTPLGIQQLKTETSHFATHWDDQRVRIDYDLKQAETDALFAAYELELKWY